MKMVRCRSCGNSLWETTARCPVCNAKQVNVRANARTKNTDDNGRDVSGLYLFLFGFFYLYYKGWSKAASVHFLLCIFMMGTLWIAIPFRAKQFVDYCEDL